MRKAVNVAVIRDDKILAVRKNLTWILPGGKPEDEEGYQECLLREISEELPGTKIEISDYFGSFVGETPHKKDSLSAEVYFGKLIGTLGNPSREISEVRFISPSQDYNLSDITRKIIYSLNNRGFL